MSSNDENYPSNSLSAQKKRRSKLPEASLIREGEPNKELIKQGKRTVEAKRIPSPRVRVKKRTFLQRTFGNLFNTEGQSVGQYMLMDVLLPAAKTTIQEMVTTGIEMLLYGSATGRRGRSKTHVAYGSYYDSGARSRYYGRERDSHIKAPGFQDRTSGIIFEYGEEADSVLDELSNLIEQYGSVSVADFYELAGIANMIEPTDNGWGWEDLSRARVVRTRHGYELNLPRYYFLEED